MKKHNDLSSIIISVVALVLSIYAAVSVTVTKQGGSEIDFENEDVRGEIFDVIDEYVDQKSGQQNQGNYNAQNNNNNEPVNVSIDDDPIKGDKDAPVTIVEFSDYECPYCGRFFRDTFPQIEENYIETGKVKYVFRDFPLSFHQNAIPAANAAECVREQGGDEMYFEYHDVLFQNQRAMDIASLKKYASEFNINQDKFSKCVDDEKYYDEINKDFRDGQSYGVTGTPGFFINGKKLSGALPYTVFEQAIEEALEEAK